jgi:hypothetical protein
MDVREGEGIDETSEGGNEIKGMNCPKCHRDTYSKKWGTCTACAINEERLTDAINKDHDPARVVGPVHPSDGEGARRGGDDQGGLAAPRTPNRRSRESYNTYMKDYMRAYRERSRG